MHAHHFVHEMGAFEFEGPGAAGSECDVGRLAALQGDQTLFHLGLVFRSDLRSRKELRCTKIVILGAVVDEVQMIGGPSRQIERAGREGVIGQCDADRVIGLCQGSTQERQKEG